MCKIIERRSSRRTQTERRGGKENIDDKEATKSKCHTNRTKEDPIPSRIEKPSRSTTRTRRHRHHDAATTDMIQQSVSRVAKAINRPQKSRTSSPTRALVTKWRDMAENGDNKQGVEYVEIWKTIKDKAREDISKCNQERSEERRRSVKTDWSHA